MEREFDVALILLFVFMVLRFASRHPILLKLTRGVIHKLCGQGRGLPKCTYTLQSLIDAQAGRLPNFTKGTGWNKSIG